MEFLLILLILSFTSKIIDGYTNCTSRPVKEGYNECLITYKSNCTADEDTPVDLVCASCPPGFQGIRWFMWDPIGQQYQLMPEYNGTGTIHFDKVREDQTDCYKCSCQYEGESFSALIGLQVNRPGKPQLVSDTAHWVGPDTYRLPTVRTNLTALDQGRVCIDATCTGAPQLTYTWYRNDSTGYYRPYDTFEDAKCDSGIQIKDNPNSHLCILPTVRELCTKGDRIQQYMVNVSNHIGHILVYVDVEFPDMRSGGTAGWFLRPHEKQSSGTVTINTDGTGTAYCVAYQDDPDFNIEYHFCRINSSVEEGYSACYTRDPDDKQCLECGKSSFQGDVTSDYEIVKNHLDMRSRACKITMKNPDKGQKYSCVGYRIPSKGGSLQQNSESVPQELGSFEFADKGLLSSKELKEIFIPSGILFFVLLVSVVIILALVYKNKKMKQGLQQVARGQEGRREHRASRRWDEGGHLENTEVQPQNGRHVSPSPNDSDADADHEDSTQLLSPVKQRVSYQAFGKTERPVDVQASLLPTFIDKIIPLTMIHLVHFVPKMVTEWEMIGILIGLEDKVAELKPRNGLPSSNLTSLFQSWIRSGLNVSWQHLMTVLQDRAVNLGAVAAEITGYLCEKVPNIPPDIDSMVHVDIQNLVHLVVPFSPHWEKIGTLLKLEDKVKELKKGRYSAESDIVKMTKILEEWATYGDELSWLNLLDILEGEDDLLPLLADIKQYLMKKMAELCKGTSTTKS